MLSALTSMRVFLKRCSLDICHINQRSATFLLGLEENLGGIRHLNSVGPTDKFSNPEINARVHERRGNNSDTFGDLSSIADVPADFVEGDEADMAEGTTYSRQQERERRKVHYSKLITELLAEKKLSMALEVLESEMKTAKAKPDRKIFADLIAFCGKVGYPQKAFSLYNQMKKRGFHMSGGIYTSLFNACGNCPIPKIGLKYAQRLKTTMDTKGWKSNAITYNAMIKAFGRSGDLETAFYLADQMMREKIPLEPRTMSFLLQGCISKKETGFLQGLQIWHKMRQFRIDPGIYSYNLLLRCVRDAGIGDLESINAVFKKLMPEEEPLQITAKASVPVDETEEVYPWDLVDSDIVHGSSDNLADNLASAVAVSSARPNLLALKPTLGGFVILDEIQSAADRLILLGGSKGVIESMVNDGLKPDIKTFTLLLDCIPSTVTAEEALINEMKINKVDPDTGFFNALIYRRGRRRDYKNGFDVLDTMKEYDVEIDNITVHSLAYCVTHMEMFQKFLDDIKAAGYSPTTPMLGSILKNALSQTSFKFIHNVMDAYQKYEVPVHKSTFQQLEEFFTKNLRLYKGKDIPPSNREKFYSGEFFRTGMKLFIYKFADWKRRVKLDETSDAHYHEQFQKTGKEAENLEPYIQKWRKGSRYTEWRRRKRPEKNND